ncbi:melatonin receptor type 1A-like [Oculina patagonica]
MADEISSRSSFLTVVEASSMILLNVLSLSGNVLVCISVCRNTRLRTTTNLYIVALAISDLLSAIFVMPLTSGVLITGRWPFGETLCQMHAFITQFVVYVSPVTMGLTAINRYVRICKSDQQYKRFFSPWKSRISLASAWMLIACYILITRLTGLQEYYFVPGYAACMNKHLSEISKIVHYLLIIVLFLLLPLIVTIISYRRVSKKIRAHNMEMAQAIRGQRGNKRMVSTHEIRISKSLFIVVFAFMLCWIPTWLIVILTRFHVVASIIQLLCSFLVNLSNTINPFIYAGMNPLFRREFRRLLLCKATERIENTQASTQRPNKFSFAERSHTISNGKQPCNVNKLKKVAIDEM